MAQTRSRSQSKFDAEFAAIITDLVGTPVRVQDSAGRTVWTSQASTWGATDADAAMPLRFPGQYHDIESGLFYNLNRYYNPDTGRYVSSDPLGLAPSPNPHAYVPNPTTQLDPLGLAAQPPHGVDSGKPSFMVDSGGGAVPLTPERISEWTSKLTDKSVNPAASRKFTGVNSDGTPFRVRVDQAHPPTPGYSGPPDPIHTLDHMHVEVRAKGATGSWVESWKVQIEWPW